MNIMKIKRNPDLNNEELYTKAKEGCVESKELLFKNNIPLLRKYVHKWRRLNPSDRTDELISIGFMGMLRAYNNFDPSKNKKYTTLLGITIWQEFIRESLHNGRSNRTKYKTYRFEEFLDKTGEYIDLNETVPNNQLSSYAQTQAKMFVHNVQKFIHINFSEREKYVFNEHHIKNRNLEEIGNSLGVTKQAVHQTYKKGLEKLLSCDLMFE